MEPLYPILCALILYGYWKYALPFAKKPMLQSKKFIVRHSPFFALMTGGFIMSLSFFVAHHNFVSIMIVLGGAIMATSFLLPYIIQTEDSSR